MRPFILDFETSIGTGPHGSDHKDPKNDFYTVIAGNSPENIQILHKAEGFGRKLPLKREILNSTHIVGHNLGFDLGYIWHNDVIKEFLIAGGKIWDTQIAEYILTAQQHQYSSLAELQTKYLGITQKIDVISGLYKKGIGADRVVQKGGKCPRLWAKYNEYCRLDGSTTLQIFKAQYLRAKQDGMIEIISLYQDYLLSLINMSCTGININVIQCEKTLTEFNLKHLEYLEQAQTLIKPIWDNSRLPTFNINSPDHKSAILFGGEIKTIVRTKVGKYKNGNDRYKNLEHKIWVDGFQIPKTLTQNTKKDGVYKVDDGIMTQIFNKTTNPKLKLYCELQKDAMMYKKAAKTYVTAFLELSVDGILYPNFNNTTVVTGRLSSSKPNLQNVSKRNKFGKILHRLFIAPPGYKCVQIDFGQLEIWVSALLSNDQNLINDLQSGIDMHCVRVSMMENCTYEHALHMCKVEEDKEWINKRSSAKTFSYQRAYGAGVKKLIEFTGLSKEQIETIIEKEELRYPDASTLWCKVRDSIEDSKTTSLAMNVPRAQKTDKNYYNSSMLLPIFDNYGNIRYNVEELQTIGYWTSITGKKYHFPDTGNTMRGQMKRSVTPTIMKNYPMQGTAADVQGATTVALLKLLLVHGDKIKMINEVHDSKWFYIKNEYVNLLIPKIRAIIEDVPTIFKERFNIDVPFKFPIDIELGENFADMETYRDE